MRFKIIFPLIALVCLVGIGAAVYLTQKDDISPTSLIASVPKGGGGDPNCIPARQGDICSDRSAGGSSARGSETVGGTMYVCKDPGATNYNPDRFTASNPSLCIYSDLRTESVSNDETNRGDMNGRASRCPVFDTYLYPNRPNKPEKVAIWQIFLRNNLVPLLPLSGLYDVPTKQATELFQSKYVDDVLTPWNLPGPTGIFYKTTRMKANELSGCIEPPVYLEGVERWWAVGGKMNDGR